MKLQHQDFRGPYGLMGRPVWPRRAAQRRKLIIRYGALAALILALVGFKRFAGAPSAAVAAGMPTAAASVPGFDPAPATAGSALNPASPGVDFFSPFLRYPAPDTFPVAGRTLVADYATDSLLQARVGLYLERYRPDAAVVLVSDLRSGRVLGVGERLDSLVRQAPKLAFHSDFPAASLIKILTATAALEYKRKGPEDSIPQLGSYHTLYRRQLKVGAEDKAPKVTLQEAFSRSVNPAFGVLGLALGGQALENTARNMGFNRTFACVKPSHYQATDTGYALAETSCGFTSKTTISPLHALAIARGIGDDGKLRYGAFARTLTDISNPAAPKELALPGDPGTAFVSPDNLAKLQVLMEATVRSGTARKGFHQVLRATHLAKLAVGGKTGSLDGLDPHSLGLPSRVETETGLGPSSVSEAAKGRYDWFIGYVRLKDDPSRGLALSIMLVHGQYANVRSTVLAALLIRDWLAAEEKARKQAADAATAAGSAKARPAREG